MTVCFGWLLNINLLGSPPPLQSQMSQNSSVVQSKTPSVVLEGLRPGTGYVVQVRARTVAGYGAYSKDMLFQTLTDGKCLAGVCVGGWRFFFSRWRGKESAGLTERRNSRG